MSDLTATLPFAPAMQAGTVPLPAPVPFDPPVLIADCATPLAGETVLTLLWRRLDRTAD